MFSLNVTKSTFLCSDIEMRARVNGVKSQMEKFEFNHCVNVSLRILSESGKYGPEKLRLRTLFTQ